MIALLLALAPLGCTAPDPDTDTEPHDTGDTDDTAPVVTGPTDHCDAIRDDETWTAEGNPHRVLCDLEVEGATLTLGPGVVVEVADDTLFDLSTTGEATRLISEGTAEAPVIIRGALENDARSSWHGIHAWPGTTEITLRHTTIWGGGQLAKEANLLVDDLPVTLDHVTLRHTKGPGLRLRGHSSFTEASTDVVVSDSQTWPLYVEAPYAHTVPALGSSYVGNVNDGVVVVGGSVDVSVTWEDLGVPYVVLDGDLELDGYAWAPAVLTLDAGVTVLFQEKRSLLLSVRDGASGLVTLGTPGAQVTLSSLGAAAGGYWYGIEANKWIAPGDLSLTHTVIEWAGTKAALAVTDAEVHLDDVTIKTSNNLGFQLRGRSRFAPSTRDLTVTGCDRVGRIEPWNVDSIPADAVSFEGNALDVVEIAFGKLERSTSWPRLDVPYWVVGDIKLEGIATAPSVLEIAPGTRIWMANDAQIEISKDGGAAGLIAEGTELEPIVFTAAQVAELGAWGGLGFFDHCEDADVRLANVKIEYGGGSPALKANLYLEDCSPARFDHLLIKGSGSYGVRARCGWPVSFEDPTYTQNWTADVLVEECK